MVASPLIGNCLNLLFGTQGWSWRLDSCLQEMGDKKGLRSREPHRVPFDFIFTKLQSSDTSSELPWPLHTPCCCLDQSQLPWLHSWAGCGLTDFQGLATLLFPQPLPLLRAALPPSPASWARWLALTTPRARLGCPCITARSPGLAGPVPAGSLSSASGGLGQPLSLCGPG